MHKSEGWCTRVECRMTLKIKKRKEAMVEKLKEEECCAVETGFAWQGRVTR